MWCHLASSFTHPSLNQQSSFILRVLTVQKGDKICLADAAVMAWGNEASCISLMTRYPEAKKRRSSIYIALPHIHRFAPANPFCHSVHQSADKCSLRKSLCTSCGVAGMLINSSFPGFQKLEFCCIQDSEVLKGHKVLRHVLKFWVSGLTTSGKKKGKGKEIALVCFRTWVLMVVHFSFS